MDVFIRELGQRQTRFGRLIFDLQYYGKTQRDICGKIPIQIDSSEMLHSFGSILVDNVHIK